jgi:hypothetical protein
LDALHAGNVDVAALNPLQARFTAAFPATRIVETAGST